MPPSPLDASLAPLGSADLEATGHDHHVRIRKSLSGLGGRPGGGLNYTRDEIDGYKALFAPCDRDGSGVAALTDLGAALAASADPSTVSRLSALASSGAVSSSRVPFEDFLLVFRPDATPQERATLATWAYPEKLVNALSAERQREIAELFRLFDSNGDGVLSRAELVTGFGDLGYDETEVEDIFEANARGRSHLTAEDFTRIMAANTAA